VDEENKMTNRQTLVDINSASVEELTSINGIGQNLANRIIEYRPFKALHDLVAIPGINETKLASLMPFMTLSGVSVKKKSAEKPSPKRDVTKQQPVSTFGVTEAFVFLEDRNERQDALLILFGGFILGLIILLLRRASK
jgi:competence ComEA-like helix-hairpin-helix protein